MISSKQKQDALLDELLKDYSDPKEILGEHGLLKQLTKRVVALEVKVRRDHVANERDHRHFGDVLNPSRYHWTRLRGAGQTSADPRQCSTI